MAVNTPHISPTTDECQVSNFHRFQDIQVKNNNNRQIEKRLKLQKNNENDNCS